MITFTENYHFGTPFKGHRGVNRGKHLSTTIFNVVIDLVLHHWIFVVAEEEAGSEGFGRAVQRLSKCFYSDNGLLAYTRAVRLQWEFYVLTEIFDLVGM